MIFVCTGTQIFQFDRLIKKIDELVENGTITEEIFAQIGAGEYLPKNYKYERYINKDLFLKYQEKANIVISHGGTGALIGASKLGKNIIAVPRLAMYNEHVDDHQIQVVQVLEREGYIRAVYEMDDLGHVIKEAMNKPITKRYKRESNIIHLIEQYIDSLK